MEQEFEKRISDASKHLLAATRVPYIHYELTGTAEERNRKPNRVKIWIIAVWIFAVCALPVAAISSYLISIPGKGSTFLGDDNRVSHSIEGSVSFEKDGYTHQILSAYIQDRRIYLELFYYRTTEGMTFTQAGFPDYQLYYNGKECGDYTKSYGGSTRLSYRLPKIDKKSDVTVSLYADGALLGDIRLIPVYNAETFRKDLPHAAVNDVTLAANVYQNDSSMTVYISAILPDDAIRGSEDDIFLIDNHQLGFSEKEIYMEDENGVTYPDMKNKYPENDALTIASFWHFHSFEIPADAEHLKIIIPEISYLTQEREEKSLTGPWEIALE